MFISYAQNFEDVMLWRALKHVHNGFYIDIGAQHPIIDSVSKGFYEQGWRGIHVEPVPNWANLLNSDRPDETVLDIAISNRNGTIELNVIPDTGLSTAVARYAEQHLEDRGLKSHKRRVISLTLEDALAELTTGREVHWLKIDVEGYEKQVLSGWNSAVLRPWIVVIEATKPNSPEVDFAEWEPILLKADYQFAYFDGLNRFYVASEHADLLASFSVPPNVFDGVRLSGKSTAAWCHLVEESLGQELNVVQGQNHRLEKELQSARSESAQWKQIGEQRLDEATRWRRELDLTNQERERVRKSLQAQLDESMRSIEELTQAFRAERAFRERHEAQLRQESDLLRARLQAQIDGSLQSIDELTRSLRAVRASREQAEQDWQRELEGKQIELRSQLTQAQQRVDELSALLQAERVSHDQQAQQWRQVSTQHLAEAQTERDATGVRIDELSRALQAERAAHAQHQATHHGTLLQLATLKQELQLSTQAAAAAHAELGAVYSSKSWRITRPLRNAVYRLKNVLRPALLWAMTLALRYRVLRAIFRPVLALAPAIDARLKALGQNHGLLPGIPNAYAARDVTPAAANDAIGHASETAGNGSAAAQADPADLSMLPLRAQRMVIQMRLRSASQRVTY